MRGACYQLKDKELCWWNYRLRFGIHENYPSYIADIGWAWEITTAWGLGLRNYPSDIADTGWVWEIIAAWGLGFEKLPVEDEDFAGLQLSKNQRMQDEWQFCLALHPGGRPLFIHRCRCRSRNDWACFHHYKVTAIGSCMKWPLSELGFVMVYWWRRSDRKSGHACLLSRNTLCKCGEYGIYICTSTRICPNNEAHSSLGK